MDRTDLEETLGFSWEDIRAEFPTAAQLIDYVFDHYPDHLIDMTKTKIVPHIFFGESGSLEDRKGMIDKVAIFNNWEKKEV